MHKAKERVASCVAISRSETEVSEFRTDNMEEGRAAFERLEDR